MARGFWIPGIVALLCVSGWALDGEQLYMSKGCYGCHGTAGEGIGDYPRLAGRSQEELVGLLQRLQRGIGHTSKRELMIPFARALDEDQMRAIARFLAHEAGTKEREEVPEDILGGFGS